MSKRMIAKTFAAVLTASAIMTAWKFHGKANRNEGYRRERRSAKCFTVVPHRTR